MEQMFKFIKKRNLLERSASSVTCAGTRPKDKKTTPSPPVRNDIVKLPRRNGNIAYNITPVVTSIHGGDDSAIDELLEGRMDLDVVLPDKKEVRMTVERRTPMMDLLVKVATPNKIKPGGHMIQVYDKGNRCLSYNPSTPIGSLDTKTVYIVPKKQHTESKKLKFEQTFRLQIRLPHNQLTAHRFSLKETLGEVKQKVCKEKNLDPSMYHLVHPNHQNKILDANMTFEEYNCKEISLLSAKSIEANSSQVEIISYQQERKKPGYQQRKGLSSIGNDNQKPASHVVKPPLRSRIRKGPAPPPPTLKENKREINSLSRDISKSDQHEIESGSHSRHSSDSSGYHEASVYSEPSNGIITSNKSEQSPKHNFLKEKTSTPKERNIESSLTKSTSPILSLNKKRKAPPPPTAQVAGKKTFELAQEAEAKNDRSSALKEAPESHNSKMDINVSQTDESMALLVHDSFDHQKLCSSKTESSVSNNENNDNELHPSSSTILHSVPDKDHESPKSFSPTLEDESPYPDETYSLSDIDKDEINREDFDKYSLSDIDEELVETIVTSVNPLGSPESDYTSKLHVQDSPLERDSDDKVETVSEKESNVIMNTEFKRTENFEDACLETLNINLMDHKINILDYSSDNETSVDEYDEKGNPVNTFRQTPLSTYNDDSETSLNNNKSSSMKNTKANVISVDEMTEEVITLYDFTPLEETPIEEDFISEILDPPEEFSNEAVVPTVTECDDDPEHPPPLPSTDPPSRPLSPETYISSISRRTLPVPLPRKHPPSQMNLLHGATSSTATNKGVLSGSSDLRGRRSSLSSLNTIDDLDQTFQSTIAEAERLLATEDQREKVKLLSESSHSSVILGPFPESDLVTRSVITDEKSNQNKYRELEETPTDFSGKPPIIFKEKSISKDLSDENYSSNHDSDVLPRRISSSSSDEDSPPPLPTSPPPPMLDDEADESFYTSDSNKQVTEMNQMSELTKPRDLSVITAVRNLGLENFTINSYKQDDNDIYSSELQSTANPQRKLKIYEEPAKPYSEIPALYPHEALCRKTRFSEVDKVEKSKSFHFKNSDINQTKPDTAKCVRIGSFQERNNSIIPVSQSDKLVYGFAGSVRGIRGQVRMRCIEITDQNNSPPLTKKATSMMDLSQSSTVESDDETVDNYSTEFSDGLRRTKSQLDISQPSSDKESESIDQIRHARSEVDVFKIPINEQDELQEEYKKLQKQLIVYQQQLLDNQKFLQKENIMPKVPLSDVEETWTLNADAEVGKSEPGSIRLDEEACPSTLGRHSRQQPHVETGAWDVSKDDFKPSDMGSQSKRGNISDSTFFVRSQSPNFGGFQNNVPMSESEKDKISVTKYPMGSCYTKNLSSDRLSKLADHNEVKRVKNDIGITLRPVSQQFKSKAKSFLYKANEQGNIAGCSAQQTNLKSIIKELSLSKQNNEPETYNYVDESLNATVADRIRAIQPSAISGNLTPQPYRLNSNHAFRLQRVKTSADSVVNESSQNDESKKLEHNMPPSIIKPIFGDNIIENNQVHDAFLSSRQLMMCQQQEIEPIPQSSSSVVENLNEHTPPVPPPLPQKNCGIVSTNSAQINGFTSHKNLNKINGQKTSNRNGDVRELLMMEIKQFAGKNALKKVPRRETNWHMRVFGPTSIA